MTGDKNKRELSRFIVTGILAVTSDMLCYYLLINFIPVDIAKGLSFIAGSFVAFFMNKLWTFENTAAVHSTAIQFSCLYSTTFIANVSVNHLVLIIFSDMTMLAFLAATGASTILNFIGMKFWVFKAVPSMNEQG